MKTLQLEQMAVVGRAEEPSLVASRMRLVFSTLEVSQSVSPFHASSSSSIVSQESFYMILRL